MLTIGNISQTGEDKFYQLIKQSRKIMIANAKVCFGTLFNSYTIKIPKCTIKNAFPYIMKKLRFDASSFLDT